MHSFFTIVPSPFILPTLRALCFHIQTCHKSFSNIFSTTRVILRWKSGRNHELSCAMATRWCHWLSRESLPWQVGGYQLKRGHEAWARSWSALRALHLHRTPLVRFVINMTVIMNGPMHLCVLWDRRSGPFLFLFKIGNSCILHSTQLPNKLYSFIVFVSQKSILDYFCHPRKKTKKNTFSLSSLSSLQSHCPLSQYPQNTD